jgi:hypothetical protein
VEVLEKSCFLSLKMDTLALESDSRLVRIEEFCFANCSLKSICILPSVESFRRCSFDDCTMFVSEPGQSILFAVTNIGTLTFAPAAAGRALVCVVFAEIDLHPAVDRGAQSVVLQQRAVDAVGRARARAVRARLASVED